MPVVSGNNKNCLEKPALPRPLNYRAAHSAACKPVLPDAAPTAEGRALPGRHRGPKENPENLQAGNRPSLAGETPALGTCPGRVSGNPGGHRLDILFLRNRDMANDLGARLLPTPDLATAPQHPTPFIQGRQPQAAAAGIPSRDLGHIESCAVVLYVEGDGVAFLAQRHRNPARPGVLGDVVEAFLQDAVDDDLGFQGKEAVQILNLKGLLYGEIFTYAICQVFQGGQQSQVLQDGGAQVPGQTPDVVDDLVQVRKQFQAFLLQVRLLLRPQPFFDGPGAEFHNRQALPHLIVQLHGETLPFMLL